MKNERKFGKLSLSFLVAIFCFFVIPGVSAQVVEESFDIPGIVEGAGKHFEITDSEYLNITLESSENVSIRIESVPEMIVLDIKASGEADSSNFILSGLLANTTYHKYQDGYEDYAPLVSDQNGAVFLSQDISQNHIIFIQPRKSTKIIRDNVTGGACGDIGNWDASSKTCTLNQDVNETIQISNDNITLNGNNHVVSGTNTGSGIYVIGEKVTIKNIEVRNFTYGIHLYQLSECNINAVSVKENNSGFYLRYANNNSIYENTFSLNKYGIRLSASHENGVENNTFSKNTESGIRNEYSNYNKFENNAISEGSFGIDIVNGSNATISNNLIKLAASVGLNLSGTYSHLSNNSIEGSVRSPLIIKNTVLENTEIEINNTIDGKPVYYLKNQVGKVFEASDVGSFYCMNCSDIIVRNNKLAKNARIYFWKTHDSTIENEFSEKTLDIVLDGSANNVLKNNDFSHLRMLSSSDNHVFGNNIYYVGDFSASVDSRSVNNFFYEALPTGGNYWEINRYCSDSNKDNFCDSQYRVGGLMYDKYPRKAPLSRDEEPACCSSVMFLPGHQASRLYRKDSDDEDRLWEPTNRNEDVKQLYLNVNGESIDSDIYTRDIIDETYGGVNIYDNFISFMDKMVSDGIINQWQYLPYDWRLPLEDIVEDGVKLENGETGDMIQEIRDSAAASKTGKVTLLGHSNGGLLGKTIIDKLKETGEEELIDRLIMVATPQLGTPKAIAGLLHGDGINLLSGFLLDKKNARGFAENMISAFNLLPSREYFNDVQSPVIEFETDVTEIFDFPTLYGDNIDNWDEFRKFLLGDDGARAKPEADDLDSPNVLSANLLARSEETHNNLDSWQAPEDLEVIQIAGWGLDTIRGIRYDDCDFIFCPDNLSNLDRSLILTQDGDETVVVPSAVEMGGDAERYYVDIKEHNKELILNARRNRSHASILEIDSLRDFISNVIQNNKDLTDHIYFEKPEVKSENKVLRFRLHSPVSLDIYDQNGNHTGLVDDPDSGLRFSEEQIPNSYYLEFGETKYAGAGDQPVDIELIGESLGTFTFEIDQVAGDQVAQNTTFANIPVMKNMKATISVSDAVGEMAIDFNNDGQIDMTLVPGEELGQDDLLEIFQEIVYYLNIDATVKDRLINKLDNSKKQMALGHSISANAMLENVKQQIETFSQENTPEKFRISKDDAEKLIEIINKIQVL